MQGARVWSLFGELDPTAATKILHAVMKIPCAATKTWYNQKNNNTRSVFDLGDEHVTQLSHPLHLWG